MKNMLYPIHKGRITADFNQMRPLTAKTKTHKHAAFDIVSTGDNKIYCPVDKGRIFGYLCRRAPEVIEKEKLLYNRYWPKKPVVHGKEFEFANYFQDVYGGIVLLEELNNNNDVISTHLFCHCYANQIFNLSVLKNVGSYSVEEKKDSRFPIIANYTDKLNVKIGDVIGYIGNAGYSTGQHVHWEIHPGEKWHSYDYRIDPVKYIVKG